MKVGVEQNPLICTMNDRHTEKENKNLTVQLPTGPDGRPTMAQGKEGRRDQLVHFLVPYT